MKLKLLTAALAVALPVLLSSCGIKVPATSHTHLSPGGDHVMLMGLKQALKPGDEVPVTLKFSDGTSHDLNVPVKAFTEEEAHYHPSETPTAK